VNFPSRLSTIHIYTRSSESIGKQIALSRVVTRNFRLYQTSVKPCWKHGIFTSNYCCLHTWVPYNTAYGMPRLNARWLHIRWVL